MRLFSKFKNRVNPYFDITLLDDSSAKLEAATSTLKIYADDLIQTMREENSANFLKQLINYFSQIVDPIVIVNKNKDTVFINDAAKELFEYDNNICLTNVFCCDSYSKYSLCVEKAISNPVKSIRAACISKSKKRIPVEYSISHICNNGKDLFITVFKNMSEHIFYQEELKKSEVMYRTFMEQSINGMFIIQDHHFILVNDALCQTVGYGMDELLDSDFNFVDIIHPTDREMVLQNYRNKLSFRNAPKTYVFKGLKKSGEKIYIEITSSVIEILDGVVWLIGTVNDVTERIHLKNQRTLEIAYFKSVFETEKFSVIIMDALGYIAAFNDTAEKLFEFGHNELSTESFTILIQPKHRSKALKTFNKILNKNLRTEFSVCYETKSGKILNLPTNCHVIEHEGSKFVVAMISNEKKLKAP